MGGLVLGPVLFHGFEVPERIRFGGRQRLAVHVLPGGGRVVDAMGADEGAVGWSGVFSGPGAAARVRLIEKLRRDGGELPLAWEGWRYSVVIESFEAEAANPAWIPYKLRVAVVGVGDAAALDEGVGAFSIGDALSFGVGIEGLDERIDAVSSGLGSENVVAALDAAEMLARLVAGRAFAGAAFGNK